MNKKRREALSKIQSTLEQAISDLEDVSGDEAEAKENLPESLQAGQQAETMEENVGAIDEAKDLIVEAKDKIEEAVGRLGDVS